MRFRRLRRWVWRRLTGLSDREQIPIGYATMDDLAAELHVRHDGFLMAWRKTTGKGDGYKLQLFYTQGLEQEFAVDVCEAVGLCEDEDEE